MRVIYIFIVTILIGSACNSNKSKSPSPDKQAAAAKDTSASGNAVPLPDIQIKSALLAAPAEKRDSCTVYGYTPGKQLTVLKRGTNELICLADDPGVPDFSVACYCKDLEPLMNRGRELRKQGMKGQELFDERAKEVKEGTLQMPKQASTLYVYSAKQKDYNPSTGAVKNGYLRYVIYIPFATVASTGLPDKPSAQGMPWIMDAGTYHAHVMINP